MILYPALNSVQRKLLEKKPPIGGGLEGRTMNGSRHINFTACDLRSLWIGSLQEYGTERARRVS